MDLSSIVWPINRLSFEPIHDEDMLLLDQFFEKRKQTDQPLLMKWVLQHKPTASSTSASFITTTTATDESNRAQFAVVPHQSAPMQATTPPVSHRFNKRLLVVSRFRLFSFKRSHPLAMAVTKRGVLTKCKEKPMLTITRVELVARRVLHHQQRAKSKPRSEPNQQDDNRHNSPQQQQQQQSELLHSICIGFEDGTVFHFDGGIHNESFMRLLQRNLNDLRLAIGVQQQPTTQRQIVIEIPSSLCHWREFSTKQTQQEIRQCFDAFLMAFRAFCDELAIECRSSVVERLGLCLDTSPSVLDFGFVLQNAASQSDFNKETQALARALCCSSLFESFVVRDAVVGDVAFSCLMRALQNNDALGGFCFSHVELSKLSMLALENAIKSAFRSGSFQSHQPYVTSAIGNQLVKTRSFQQIDLSFNRFNSSMALSMANTIQALPSGLETLNMEGCQLAPRGMCQIISSMKKPCWSSRLHDLNLSSNELGRDGSFLLSDWITGAFALCRLQLANTRLDTAIFFKALKQNTLLHETSLHFIDISYNSMVLTASEDLGLIMAKTQTLCVLVLRNMKLTKHDLHQILRGAFQNTLRSFPLSIDLSENDLSGKKAQEIAQLLAKSPSASRECLCLDDCGLRDDAFVDLLKALAACQSLDSLSLEGNGMSRKGAYSQMLNETGSLIDKRIGDALNQLLSQQRQQHQTLARRTKESLVSDHSDSAGSSLQLQNPPPLKELFLGTKRSDREGFGLEVLLPCVHALRFNCTLVLLDVSGNKSGDELLKATGRMLPLNKTLKALFIDENDASVNGFLMLHQGLMLNQSLVLMPMPIKDTRKILEERDPPRDKLFGVLGKIYKIIERNQSILESNIAAAASREHEQQQQMHDAVSAPERDDVQDLKNVSNVERKTSPHSDAKTTSITTKNNQQAQDHTKKQKEHPSSSDLSEVELPHWLRTSTCRSISSASSLSLSLSASFCEIEKLYESKNWSQRFQERDKALSFNTQSQRVRMIETCASMSLENK